MMELKNRSNSKENELYARMRFFSRKQQSHETRKSSFLSYYKWMLCFIAALYVFASFSVTHKPVPLRTRTTLSESDAVFSRALLEPRSFSRPAIATRPASDMRIYVYDLPSRFNYDWLSNNRCSNHLFASEVAIHRALLNDQVFRTLNAEEADFFFVPVYVSCNFSSENGFPAIGHAKSLLASAVDFISTAYPFWNRSQGSDHVFVASHDYGACFHAMEDRAKEAGIPMFLRKSIILQTFGVNYDHPCQDVENIVIPPYVSPDSVLKTLTKFPELNRRRDIWAFFRGKMEVHPKNIDGRFYGKKVRTEIWRRFKSDRRFSLRRHRFPGYQAEIARSVFCLCPLGWAPWSPRLVESVALGCVPVIIADGIRLPFPGAVPWPEISLTVAEKDVGELGKILEYVAATNLSAIQRNLWNPRVAQALLFHDSLRHGDATWHVLVSLSHKLSNTGRNRGGFIQ